MGHRMRDGNYTTPSQGVTNLLLTAVVPSGLTSLNNPISYNVLLRKTSPDLRALFRPIEPLKMVISHVVEPLPMLVAEVVRTIDRSKDTTVRCRLRITWVLGDLP